MTREQLIRKIARETGISLAESEKALDITLEAIIKEGKPRQPRPRMSRDSQLISPASRAAATRRFDPRHAHQRLSRQQIYQQLRSHVAKFLKPQTITSVAAIGGSDDDTDDPGPSRNPRSAFRRNK